MGFCDNLLSSLSVGRGEAANGFLPSLLGKYESEFVFFSIACNLLEERRSCLAAFVSSASFLDAKLGLVSIEATLIVRLEERFRRSAGRFVLFRGMDFVLSGVRAFLSFVDKNCDFDLVLDNPFVADNRSSLRDEFDVLSQVLLRFSEKE